MPKGSQAVRIHRLNIHNTLGRIMKFIVRLFGFILALAVLLAVIAFLLPKQQHVERSLQIDAPAAVIQPFLTTPKKFNQWSPWATIDPEGTRYSYAGPESGVGAKLAWNSDHREVGNGTQEVKAVSDERVDIYLDFGPQGDANAYYLLEPNKTGTKVTWAFDTDLGNNPIMRWFGMLMDKMVGEKYEEGLQNLNREAKKAYEDFKLKEAASEGPYIEPTLEIRTVESTPIAFVRGTSSSDPDTIGPALAKAYEKLMAVVQAQELNMAGAPLAVNELYDPETDVYNFQAAFPLESTEGLDLGEGIEIGQTYAGRVIQATHKGSYKNLPKTYEIIEEYMNQNGFIKNGNSWEQYITDPTTVAQKDIVTMIYWPILEQIDEGIEDNIAEPIEEDSGV